MTKTLINDTSLNQVTGGSYYYNQYWDNPNDVVFRFNVGDEVEVNFYEFWTRRYRIVGQVIGKTTDFPARYYERYQVVAVNPAWYAFSEGTIDLCDIEK